MSKKEALTVDLLPLDDDWFLKADTDNWALYYLKENPREDGNGVKLTKHITYHGNIEQALKKYLSEALKPSKDIKDLEVLLRKAYANINKIVKQLKQT